MWVVKLIDIPREGRSLLKHQQPISRKKVPGLLVVDSMPSEFPLLGFCVQSAMSLPSRDRPLPIWFVWSLSLESKGFEPPKTGTYTAPYMSVCLYREYPLMASVYQTSILLANQFVAILQESSRSIPYPTKCTCASSRHPTASTVNSYLVLNTSALTDRTDS